MYAERLLKQFDFQMDKEFLEFSELTMDSLNEKLMALPGFYYFYCEKNNDFKRKKIDFDIWYEGIKATMYQNASDYLVNTKKIKGSTTEAKIKNAMVLMYSENKYAKDERTDYIRTLLVSQGAEQMTEGVEDFIKEKFQEKYDEIFFMNLTELEKLKGEFDFIENKLKSIIDTLKISKDTLVSLSSNMRQYGENVIELKSKQIQTEIKPKGIFKK